MVYAIRRRKRTMARYGDDSRKRHIVDRGAADIESGRQDTECRGEQPASDACPAPNVVVRRRRRLEKPA
jgi:hypothetical protein